MAKRRAPLPVASSPPAIYVGIDPGTYCGWALLDATGKRIASGTWDLSTRRHEGGGMRYLRARRYLEELLQGTAVRALGYEEVASHKGIAAAHVYGGIVSQITSVCEELSVPYNGIPVGTVKKRATGNGNAGKPLMIAAARDHFGVEHLDPEKPKTWSDEADALWVAEVLREGLEAA